MQNCLEGKLSLFVSANSANLGHDDNRLSRHCLDKLAENLLADPVAVVVGRVVRVEAELPGTLQIPSVGVPRPLRMGAINLPSSA